MWPFRRDAKNDIPNHAVENTIGPGTIVRGSLAVVGGCRVDGMVEGSIEATGPVVIGESGTVAGGVTGSEVVVLGRVRGDVRATGHLEIGPTGKVVGDVTVESFRMHKGGVFLGTSRMAAGDDLASPVLPAADDLIVGEEPARNGSPPALPPGKKKAPVIEITSGSEASGATGGSGPRGRTLPPPDGAVPPPAGEMAGAEGLASEERLITGEEPEVPAKTGT